ncbi:hypothetical protein BH23BAC3_BH23BAC3_14120 [soil metagenome]
MEHLQIARNLDPLSLSVNSIYGLLLGELGLLDEAIQHLKDTMELAPFPVAHAILGHIYMGNGHINEAIKEYEKVFEIVPTSFYAGFLGHAYARAGRIEDSGDMLSVLIDRSGQGEHISPGAIGWIYLGLGNFDEGYVWLEKAVNQRDVFLTIYGMLSNKYLIAPFIEDDRFKALKSNAGLLPLKSSEKEWSTSTNKLPVPAD